MHASLFLKQVKHVNTPVVCPSTESPASLLPSGLPSAPPAEVPGTGLGSPEGSRRKFGPNPVITGPTDPHDTQSMNAAVAAGLSACMLLAVWLVLLSVLAAMVMKP